MILYVDAIYDGGVLNPVEPLGLPDQARVRLQIDVEDAAPPAADQDHETIAEVVRRQREAARRLDEKLAGLPDLSPDDGLIASVDHDQILYGEPT